MQIMLVIKIIIYIEQQHILEIGFQVQEEIYSLLVMSINMTSDGEFCHFIKH